MTMTVRLAARRRPDPRGAVLPDHPPRRGLRTKRRRRGGTDGPGGGDDDGNPGSHDDAMAHDDAHPADAHGDATRCPRLPGLLDVRLDCHNDCTLIANPSAINVSAAPASSH